VITFEEMGLSQPVIRALSKMGFEAPTAIQELAIVPAMEGRDMIGQAQTGTGKTAAFAIPLVERIGRDERAVRGLIVTPTRELAVQVAEEINSIGLVKGIRALPIYGGQDINLQIRSLKSRPQIIVGTPGRLLDHVRRKTIRLEEVFFVVLDEADEMLNMGFIEDIETILRHITGDRQMLLFSATMPAPVQELARRFMRNPELIRVKTKEVTLPGIVQHYIEVHDRQKFDILCRLLDIQAPELAIIFCRTKRRVDEVSEALKKRGYLADGIHGDLTQSKRDRVMSNFKSGNAEILVTTDVAARGLDINGISHVYNFDIPQDPDSYVHRIGRTGRLGKAGAAVTLVTHRELYQLRMIELATKRKMLKHAVPTFTEALEEQQRLAIDKLLRVVDEKETHQYHELAQSLLEEHDSATLLSAALKIITKEPVTTPVQLTEEPARSMKSPKGFRGLPPGLQRFRREKKEGWSDFKKKRTRVKNFIIFYLCRYFTEMPVQPDVFNAGL